MYGVGAPVTDLTQILETVNANPLVVSTSLADLNLAAGSPTIQERSSARSARSSLSVITIMASARNLAT